MPHRTHSAFARLSAIALLAALALLHAAPAAADAASEAPATEGEGGGSAADAARDAWVAPDVMGDIYAAQCAVCHGAQLEGAAQGPSLLAEPLVHGDTVDALVASIAKGYPDKGMPQWEAVLPADDIRGLAIYLLEKRAVDPGDAGQGVGPPPVVPDAPIESELHAFAVLPVAGGFAEPYSIAPLPDGRILVTEKMRGLSIVSADGATTTLVEGTPRVYDDSVLRGTSYAGQGWMHEVALHPDYAENGWIYLSYGDRCEQCNAESRSTGKPVSMLKLVRGRLDGARWVDPQTVWEAPKETYQAGLENGAAARIAFDRAGHVFLAVGMFVDYRGIQSLDLPYGKIHRVRDDGRIPDDNPFARTPGAMKSVYTLGHRNPQGLAFDAPTGILWSSEHGPRGGDETNILRAGRNYGWPLVSLGVDYDGRPIHYAQDYGIEFDPATLEPPVVDWTPSPGLSSLVVYRGDAFPRWDGHLLQATLRQNDLYRVVADANGLQHRETLIAGLGRFRDIEIGPAGDVLVLLEHRAGSRILRLVPVPGGGAAEAR